MGGYVRKNQYSVNYCQAEKLSNIYVIVRNLLLAWCPVTFQRDVQISFSFLEIVKIQNTYGSRMMLLSSYVFAKLTFSLYLIENVLDCTLENFNQMLKKVLEYNEFTYLILNAQFYCHVFKSLMIGNHLLGTKLCNVNPGISVFVL